MTTTTNETSSKPDNNSSTSIINKWTLEELDLKVELATLESLVCNKQHLVEKLFDIVPRKEIEEMVPDNLKDMPLDILIDLCILHLDNNVMTDTEIDEVLKGHERPVQQPEKLLSKQLNLPHLIEPLEVKEETEEQVRAKERRAILDKMDQQLKVRSLGQESFMRKQNTNCLFIFRFLSKCNVLLD